MRVCVFVCVGVGAKKFFFGLSAIIFVERNIAYDTGRGSRALLPLPRLLSALFLM